MFKVIHGLQAQYDALAGGAGYDNDMLYFITDSHRIYKGSILMAEANNDENVIFVTEAPEFATAKENVIYVHNTDEDTLMYIKGKTGMKVVSGGQLKDGSISSIDMIADDILTTSAEVTANFAADDDAHLVTAGAVAKAIAYELKDYAGGAFTGVTAKRVEKDEANETAGTVLEFTTASGETTSTVRISDMFLTNAAYDSTTHMLKLFVQGSEDPVEVNLEDLVPQACSTADVQLSEKIVATVAVGNIKKGQEIDVQDLQSFLTSMLSSDSMPTVTQPSVTLTGTEEIKAYEVGSVINEIAFGASFNKGGYSQTAKNNQVASGATPKKWTLKCTGQQDQVTESTGTSVTGTFTGLTVEDGTSISVSATCEYTAGDEVPLSYLGKTNVDGVETSTKKIAAGSKNASKGTITGYRNLWYGYKGASNLIADPANITVEQIKALTAAQALPNKITATGMQQMFFAVPKTKASSLSIMGANPPAPQDVVGPFVMKIGGVNNHAPIDYNVWYVSNASAASGSDTYTLTWK